MKAQVLPTYCYSFLTTYSSQPSPPSSWTSQEAGLHGDGGMHLTLYWHTVSPLPGPSYSRLEWPLEAQLLVSPLDVPFTFP